MTNFMNDIALLRDVLQANNVGEFIDEDILQALLQLYESDAQRVDLVVLELEGMIGKPLSVGAQLERWDELMNREQQLSPDIQIEYQNVRRFHGHVEEVMIDESTSYTAPPDLLENHTAMQKDPLLLPEKKAKTVKKESESPSHSQRSKAVKRSFEEVSTNTSNIAAKLEKKSEPVNQINSVDSNIGQASGSSSGNMEVKAVKYHKAIIGFAPHLHVKFAAFKAAAMILMNDTLRLDELVSQCGLDKHFIQADVEWDVPEIANPELVHLYQHVFDQHLKEQLDFLVVAVPDADPDFLEDRVRMHQGNQEKIRNFVTELLENGSFPTRADYNKRKEYNELASKYFTAEEFLEMYDDPFKHFNEDARVTDMEYRDEAINQLKSDFRYASVNTIRYTFREFNYHYSPTYCKLAFHQDLNQRKTKRSLSECLKEKTKHPFLLQEIAFTRVAPQIKTYLETKVQLHKEAVAAARASGTLLECPICCEDELIEEDLVDCSLSHQTCRNCVRRQSEEQIGLMKNHVRCLFPDCKMEYSLPTLKEVLGKSVYSRLEKRRQAEEVLAAGIEGLESCPFCEYCEVPREADKVFHCQNPECGKVSCRLCREVNHLPLSCEEHTMSLRLRNYVESKMTEALMRECPACKRRFVKTDGCNKMTCVCGAFMCYICRKQIEDYKHFASSLDKPGMNRCPLYIDTNKLHEDEVAKSAARARAELQKKNPDIRVGLVLGKQV